jgi:ketosteroid isomerase-like protein
VDRKAESLKELKAEEEAAIQAFGKKDGALAASFYAPEAALMMANMKLVQGKEIPGLLKEMMADPNFSMKFETQKLEVAASGELGYSRGAYVLTMTDGATKKAARETGKYVTVYGKQADGRWKIVEDVSTPDGPAAGVEKQ